MSATYLRNPRRARQEGSAYMLALLVLVVLTVLGLSLATTTGLEMEIGTAERAITRTFYGSDSGLQWALARALTRRDYAASNLNLYSEARDLAGGGVSLSRGFNVGVTHMVPINTATCNLCGVNENEQKFWRVNHAVTSTATELSWLGTDTTPGAEAQTQAQKTLTIMFEVEPFWQPPPLETINMTPEQAADVKF